MPKKIRDFAGKERLKPLFSIQRLRELDSDCCQVLFVSNDTLAVLHDLADVAEWPTRWIDGSIEEIEEFTTRMRVEIMPCNIEALTSVLELLASRLQAGNSYDNGVSDMSRCGCCSCCGGGGGGTYGDTRPDIPTNPPIPDGTTIDSVNACNVACYVVESLSGSLARMATYTWGQAFTLAAVALAVGVLAGPLGWEVSAVAIGALLEAVTVSQGSSAVFSAAKSSFESVKGDLKCILFNVRPLSGENVKAAYFSWLHQEFIDGEFTFLILSALGLFLDWNGFYSDVVLADECDCSDCATVDPPINEVPDGYRFEPVGMTFGEGLYSSLETFSHSEETGLFNCAITLVNNNVFFDCTWHANGGTEDAISGNIVGLLLVKVSLVRGSALVPLTYIRNMVGHDQDSLVGQFSTNVAILYTDGTTVLSDMGEWLTTNGYRIIEDSTRGGDNSEVMEGWNFRVHDKHRTTPASVRLSVSCGLYYIVQGA